MRSRRAPIVIGVFLVLLVIALIGLLCNVLTIKFSRADNFEGANFSITQYKQELFYSGNILNSNAENTGLDEKCSVKTEFYLRTKYDFSVGWHLWVQNNFTVGKRTLCSFTVFTDVLGGITGKMFVYEINR